MRIREIYIDGFGIYSNVRIRNLPRGFLLFFGQNESGKTTLMEFIRTALFGFPSRQWKQHYPPLRGGTHGGRMVIEFDDHPSLISELKNGKVQLVTVDGQPVQTSLSDLLHGIDRTTYGRIFAIGLEDLQGLDFFREPDFAGRILAASAGLHVGRLPDALKILQDEIDQYHRPRARKPLLNQLFAELNRVQHEIKQCQKDLNAYRNLTEQCHKLAAELENLRTEKRHLERQRLHLELLHKARRSWVNWSRASEQCQALEYVAGFPSNGAQQMKTLLEKKADIQQDLEREKRHLESVKQTIASISLQESILAAADEIRALDRERQKFQTAFDDIHEIRLKTRSAREKFQKALHELGAGWDEKRLLSVDASLPVRQKARLFETSLREKRRTLERLEQECESLYHQRQEQKKIIDELKERENALPTIESSIFELTEKHHQLERLYDLLRQHTHLVEKIEQAKLTLQNLSLLINPVPTAPSLPSPGVLILLALMLGGAAVGIFFSTHAGFLSPMSIPVAILLVCSVILVQWARKLAHTLPQQQVQFHNQQRQLQKQLTETNDYLHQLQKEQIDLQQKITTMTTALGISSPRPERIRLMQQKIAEDLNALQNQEALKTELQKQLKRMHDLETRFQNCVQKREEAKKFLETAEKEWTSWVTERGFDAALRPASFETLLEHLEKTLTYRETWREYEERFSLMEQYLSEMKEKIQKIYKNGGLKVPENPSPQDIDRLMQHLNEQEKRRDARQQLQSEASRVEATLQRLATQLDEIETSIHKLLERAGCQNVDEFFHRAELFSHYRQYLEEMEKHETALLALTGNKTTLKRIMQELEKTDEERVSADLNEIRQRLNDIEKQEREKVEIYGRLKEKIAHLETEERLSMLLFERVRIQNKIKQAIQAWGTRVLTLHFINRAREIYEHLRQPEVIRQADTLLKTMTDGRYNLILSSDDHSILLEDRGRQRKTEKQWSHGLADQVYLAVRLGLARHFTDAREAVPLILDDILVRFDEFRQQKAIECLLAMAQHHQIFFFTCRPGILEAVRAMIRKQKQTPSFEYYQLNDGQILPSTQLIKNTIEPG